MAWDRGARAKEELRRVIDVAGEAIGTDPDLRTSACVDVLVDHVLTLRLELEQERSQGRVATRRIQMRHKSHRSGPASGYDFGNKRQYRRDIWAAASRWCGGVDGHPTKSLSVEAAEVVSAAAALVSQAVAADADGQITEQERAAALLQAETLGRELADVIERLRRPMWRTNVETRVRLHRQRAQVR